MKLIPLSAVSPTASYYCTWTNQGNWHTPENVYMTALDMRDRIGSEFLFGDDGVLNAHPKCIRGDLLVVLDDGWDVPHGTDHSGENDTTACFGSMCFDGEKFPEVDGLSPSDRLVKISKHIRDMGYAGLGLWVPSSFFEEDPSVDRADMLRNAEEFWTERGKWCAKADIKYLKVDWGYHGRDVEYRKTMTDAVKKQSPNTLIEHIIGIFDMPYDPEPDVQDTPQYRDFQALGRRTLAVSDVFRTYDVVDGFSTATTVMRVVKFFDGEIAMDASLLGLINVEDEVLVAASLGFAMGIMRHRNSPNYLEVAGAARWQRIAPPFRAESGQLIWSDELLYESKFFDSDPSLWPYVGQKTIKQYAPARVARCVPLPEVKTSDEENTPFVLCSKNPVSGAYSVASLSRTAHGKIKYRTTADIAVLEAEIDAPVGIFGSFGSLTINFVGSIDGKKVYLQNLYCADEAVDEASDITDSVRIDGCSITLDGKMLEKFAEETSKATPCEKNTSENAFVLKIV